MAQAKKRTKSKLAAKGVIQHVFVLMLENRSFDHFYGLSGLSGVPAPPALQPGAADRLQKDPPHEWLDVKNQINNGQMNGFPAGDARKGFAANARPLLTSLARDNLLMDNWYSSMPGPTWPNRLFAHGASSGGLGNSPKTSEIISAVREPAAYMQLEHGHIFTRLSNAGKRWRVYHGDSYPNVLCLEGMVDKRGVPELFRTMGKFKYDVEHGDVAEYTWIEPDYSVLSLNPYKNGNSQHPIGSVSSGERLIKTVYESIFGPKSKVRNDSVLVVTWDEHGGFFESRNPPTATAPGDKDLSSQRESFPGERRFDRLGPRVPAILISPWLPRGLGSQVFPGKVFDHSSIVATLRQIYGLGAPITNRDANAPSWYTPSAAARPISPTLPAVKRAPAPAGKVKAITALDGTLKGMFNIALDIDWDVSTKTARPPLFASDFDARLARLNSLTAAPQARLVLDYLAAVQQRDSAFFKKLARPVAAKRRKAPGEAK